MVQVKHVLNLSDLGQRLLSSVWAYDVIHSSGLVNWCGWFEVGASPEPHCVCNG